MDQVGIIIMGLVFVVAPVFFLRTLLYFQLACPAILGTAFIWAGIKALDEGDLMGVVCIALGCLLFYGAYYFIKAFKEDGL